MTVVEQLTAALEALLRTGRYPKWAEQDARRALEAARRRERAA